MGTVLSVVCWSNIHDQRSLLFHESLYLFQDLTQNSPCRKAFPAQLSPPLIIIELSEPALKCSVLIITNVVLFFCLGFVCFFKYRWCTVSCQLLLYSKVTQLHIYVHSFSHIILHHVPSRDYIYFPVLYSRMSLLIHSECNSLNYQPQMPRASQTLPLPHGNHKSVLHVREFGVFFCR